VIGLLSFLIRLVAVLFLVRMVVRGVHALMAPARRTATAGGGVEVVDLVRDRICNTFLPRAKAVVATVGDHEELFCSSSCAQRALAETSSRA
jgi:hypothetical protein